MRSILSISTAVFIIVVAGGLCINWYMQSAQAKHAVERAIANINATQKDATHPLLEYQAITTSGFPSNVVVTIVKPHFAGRIDQLLQQSPSANRQKLPEWFADTTLDGNVTLSVNALSNRYTLTVSGNWQSVNTIGDTTIAMSSQASGDTVCNLDTAHGGGLLGALWSFETLGNEHVLRDLRMLDCVVPSFTVIDPQSQKKLMSGAGSRIYITSDQVRGQEHLRVYLKFADMETTDDGNKLMQSYMSALFPGTASAPLTMAGKQNAEMDFSYTGPEDLEGNIGKAPIDVYLSKFSVANPYYTSNGTLHVTDTPAGDKRSSSIDLDATSTFSAQYDTLLKEAVKSAINQCAASPAPECQPVQKMLAKQSAEALYALVSPGVPNLPSLGKLTQKLKASYEGSANFMNGDVNLSALELSADPYGISGSGTVHSDMRMMPPAANITLSCTNCLQLVDDAAAYIMRLQKIGAAMNPEQHTAPLDPAEVDGMKKFLSAIAVPSVNPAGQTVFGFAVVNDQNGISINGKPITEVMRLYSEYAAKPKH